MFQEVKHLKKEFDNINNRLIPRAETIVIIANDQKTFDLIIFQCVYNGYTLKKN